MSSSVSGLRGPRTQSHDTGLFVQQLLDSVQVQDFGTPTSTSPTRLASMEPLRDSAQQTIKPDPGIADEVDSRSINNTDPVVDVPHCLIFGGETGEDEYLVPARCLKKLPNEVVANLLKDGERMGSIHRLGSIQYWESMVRLNHYLDHGDYKPFKPAVPIEWLDSNGTARVWNSKEDPNTVEIPGATTELFMKEIDLYVFTAKIGYTELRRLSAERLCNSYPKSSECVISLIDKAGPHAVRNDDRMLLQRIISYINANCKELTAMPGGQFLTLLRKMARGKPPLGSAMLEAYFSASEAIRRELSLKDTLADGLSVTIAGNPKCSIKPSTLISDAKAATPLSHPAIASPLDRPAPALPANFNSPLSPYDIPNLVEALERGCLVVAHDNGYGTLVKNGQRKACNTSFTFKKGEILVADRLADTVNGRHNMLVMNSRGELGDILRTLVKKILPGLGALPSYDSVNDGSSSRLSEHRPDREERKFCPVPSSPGYRARSRSPLGPLSIGPGPRPGGPSSAPRRTWASHPGKR